MTDTRSSGEPDSTADDSSDTESWELVPPPWEWTHHGIKGWPHYVHIRMVLIGDNPVETEKQLRDLVAVAKGEHFRDATFTATFKYLKRSGVVRKRSVRRVRQLHWVAKSATPAVVAYLDRKLR